jgi:hypothetical protein
MGASSGIGETELLSILLKISSKTSSN